MAASLWFRVRTELLRACSIAFKNPKTRSQVRSDNESLVIGFPEVFDATSGRS
jgi:hypothetical protein